MSALTDLQVSELILEQPPSQLLTGSSLDISIYRGQHTALPPTPPPDYVERDIVRPHSLPPYMDTDISRQVVCTMD